MEGRSVGSLLYVVTVSGDRVGKPVIVFSGEALDRHLLKLVTVFSVDPDKIRIRLVDRGLGVQEGGVQAAGVREGG